MQNECIEINQKLDDYLNRRLTPDENGIIIKHLAVCEDCKKEVAFLIKLKNTVKSLVKELPNDIAVSAFDKIPDENSFESILSSSSVFKGFDLIKYAFSEVRKTMDFAFNNI